MKFLSSLKYRIAITIFVLELCMLSAVLWQTQELSYSLTKSETELQDKIIVELLSEVSSNALFISDFTPLQSLFERVSKVPHIRLIVLTDHRNRAVASSDINFFGQVVEDLESGPDEYWSETELENFAGVVGHLYIKLSHLELEMARNESVKLGISIGIISMFVIAVVGLFFGYLLTRRLNQVIVHTQKLANGNLQEPLEIKGADEVAELSRSLNKMSFQLSQSFESIAHMAYHDSLTGLVNRVEFSSRLSKSIHSAKNRDDIHALMFLDLDQFKIVNDTSGHDAGDQLLVELSNVLKNVLRTRDTLGRLGGDEFGVLLEHCPINEASQVANKLCSAVKKYKFKWQGKFFRVGLSIGLVPVTSASPDLTDLMSQADIACYEAKNKGGNTIHIAAPELMESSVRADEMRWVSQLSGAIENNRWKLHFQKIIRLDETQKTLFGEFLLRLETDNGLVAPASFLHAAERYNLMPKIDIHVVEQVFKIISDQPEHKRPVISFINLSGLTIVNDEFVTRVKKLLQNSSLKASSICFEITETAAVNNIEVAIEFIHQLKLLGFMFALDDFGSGMSSFNFLKRLPIDFVKIDGSFIQDMLKHNIDRSIVSSVHSIAQLAGFRTIAEFVENDETLRELKAIGIDYAQGYVIHKPGSYVTGL